MKAGARNKQMCILLIIIGFAALFPLIGLVLLMPYPDKKSTPWRNYPHNTRGIPNLSARGSRHLNEEVPINIKVTKSRKRKRIVSLFRGRIVDLLSVPEENIVAVIVRTRLWNQSFAVQNYRLSPNLFCVFFTSGANSPFASTPLLASYTRGSLFSEGMMRTPVPTAHVWTCDTSSIKSNHALDNYIDVDLYARIGICGGKDKLVCEYITPGLYNVGSLQMSKQQKQKKKSHDLVACMAWPTQFRRMNTLSDPNWWMAPTFFEYYIYGGVSHFYVYILENQENALSGLTILLQPLISQGIVTLIILPQQPNNFTLPHRWLQDVSATHCTWNVRGRSRWAMTWVDLDEYLAYIPNRSTDLPISGDTMAPYWIPQLLDKVSLNETAGLYFQKRPAYLPPGDIPDLLSTNMIDDTHLGSAMGKTFVRPNLVSCQSLHYPWRIAKGAHIIEFSEKTQRTDNMFYSLLHFKKNDWSTWTISGKEEFGKKHRPVPYKFPLRLQHDVRTNMVERWSPSLLQQKTQGGGTIVSEGALPITSSISSGLRYTAGVVTLGDSKLDSFVSAWSSAWPGLRVGAVHSFLNSRQLQGYGILASMCELLRKANLQREEYDYLLLFEDDAKPFHGTIWPKNLDKVAAQLAQVHGGGICLGCHNVRPRNLNDKPRDLISQVQGAWGAYAWMIPSGMVPCLEAIFRRRLFAKVDKVGAPDNIIWDMLRGSIEPGEGPLKMGNEDEKLFNARDICGDQVAGVKSKVRRGFICNPLLVDHHAPAGDSKTWHGIRRKNFEGNPEWWTHVD